MRYTTLILSLVARELRMQVVILIQLALVKKPLIKVALQVEVTLETLFMSLLHALVHLVKIFITTCQTFMPTLLVVNR